jgi:hypothetical protein
MEGITYLLTLSVEQIRRQGTLWHGAIVLLLDVPLVVSLERLLELDLLGMSLGMVELGLETEELLGLLRVLVRHTGFTLSPREREERRRDRQKGVRKIALSRVQVEANMAGKRWRLRGEGEELRVVGLEHPKREGQRRVARGIAEEGRM